MKRILPLMAVAAAAVVFTTPVLACEFHQSHAAMKTVEAQPAPQVPAMGMVPASQPAQASQKSTDALMSQPLGAAYENCHRARKNTTVDLTQ
jgi:hypothetical protein